MITPEYYDTLSFAEAIAIQKALRHEINTMPTQHPLHLIGGADISFNKFEETVFAGIVLLTYPQLEIHSKISVTHIAKFPYRSGLLAFRELPALLKAWEQLTIKPDVLVLDGQGIAHPRRLGIATHFGLATNTITIGCAKSRLTGTYIEPQNKKFAAEPLMDKQEQIGVVLRTKINCKPVFISPGNKISLDQSIQVIEKCTKTYRIPEPTRLAHILVNQERVAFKNNPSPKLF